MYEDYRVLGKHFRVQSSNNLNLSRHYTICNVMAPYIYRSYLEALRTDSPLNTAVLNTKAKDSCHFTIKNYNKPSGMSYRFFDQDES